MTEFCDLHTHSTRSDGQDSVRELIDNAAATEGLKAFALCDHDVVPPKTIDVDGEEISPVDYAAKKGLMFIPGIEISCDTYVDDVHIVGIFCDFDTPGMKSIEDSVTQSKIDGYHALCDMLVKKGMDVSWQYITEGCGRKESEVQRKHIFEAISEKGYVADWKDAKIMVRDDKELNIKRAKPDPIKAINIIHEAGGVAILAHPHLIDEEVTREDGTHMTRAEYIDMLISAGLDGIEADYPYLKTSYKGNKSVDEIAGSVYRTYSARVKFLSGGSDYHAEHKKGNMNARRIGEGRIPYDYFKKMILIYK